MSHLFIHFHTFREGTLFSNHLSDGSIVNLLHQVCDPLLCGVSTEYAPPLHGEPRGQLKEKTFDFNEIIAYVCMYVSIYS